MTLPGRISAQHACALRLVPVTDGAVLNAELEKPIVYILSDFYVYSLARVTGEEEEIL